MKKILIIATIIAIFLVYSPSTFVFFSADDWFHLRVSQISNWHEFLNFFSFSKSEQSISFYRPLSTQVFFFIFQKLFGLNPIPYHLFVLICFGFSLFLIYKLTLILFKNKQSAILSALIYGFSVSNFTRLYFLSAFQEIALVFFSLLCILNHLKKTTADKLFALCFFVLALLSKETAVVLPLILLVIDWAQKKTNLKKIIPYFLILALYLYFRLFHFGGTVGETYVWNFSPSKAANTLMWYIFWAVGAPELLVDYIGSGLRPIPRFFTDYPNWWFPILGLLILNISSLIYLTINNLKKIDRKIVGFAALFVISLLPVLFLPQHKFALELGLPLVWFSLVIAWILPEKGNIKTIFIFFYLALNLSMNYLTYTRHYSVNRAKIAENVYLYFSHQYPRQPVDSYFEFVNDTKQYTKEWGSSKQIANSIGGSELFRVLYKDSNYKVYFEDFSEERPQNMQEISISSKMFFK